MNILVVSQYYYPEPFRINEICEELVRRGHRVAVLTANPNYPDGEIYNGYKNEDNVENINGVVVYRCKSRPRLKGNINLGRNYIDFVFKAKRKIKQLQTNFDSIYVYQLSPVTSCLPAIKYKKMHHVPMVIYCLDVWPESLKGTALDNCLAMGVFRIISKYIYCSANKLVVTSPVFVKYLSDLCGIDESEIAYLPQHSVNVDICEVSSEFKKDANKVNFLFTGNIGEAQNIECLIRALSNISDRSKIMFHIVGSGSHYENCVKLAEELDVNDAIIFYGRYPKSEMPKFYAIADVCYVSLKNEGIVGKTIPGKVQEYMSAGKPILACMNGDAKRVVEEAKCGICVDADNIVQLSDAIVEYTKKQCAIKELGLNAHNYYLDTFTLKRHADKLENILSKMIKRG